MTSYKKTFSSPSVCPANLCESFPPSVDDRSAILILGSMPGIRSLTEQQYYAHPQNRFWKVMTAVCDTENLWRFDYQKKLAVLLEHNIALWDTIRSCNRAGSLDSAITDEQPNDINGLLKKYPGIKSIVLNGGKAFSFFQKHFPDIIKCYPCRKMPSTSPANAGCDTAKLIKEWLIIRDFMP